MAGPDVMFPEEQQQMSMVCQRLARDANAKEGDFYTNGISLEYRDEPEPRRRLRCDFVGTA